MSNGLSKFLVIINLKTPKYWGQRCYKPNELISADMDPPFFPYVKNKTGPKLQVAYYVFPSPMSLLILKANIKPS